MTPVDLIISTVQAGDTFWVTHFYRAQSAEAQPRQRSWQILFSWRQRRTEKYWRSLFFSHPNLIITSRRFRILIKTVGRKVLVKYCANLFSEDQLDAIVERAAVTWLELKERRVGQGS